MASCKNIYTTNIFNDILIVAAARSSGGSVHFFAGVGGLASVLARHFDFFVDVLCGPMQFPIIHYRKASVSIFCNSLACENFFFSLLRCCFSFIVQIKNMIFYTHVRRRLGQDQRKKMRLNGKDAFGDMHKNANLQLKI
jgi:hypothetical protein